MIDLVEDSFWTSGITIENQATKWMSNNKLATYTNWAPAEPNNVASAESCIQFYEISTGLKWNDVRCDEVFYFICERDRSQPKFDFEFTIRLTDIMKQIT